MATRKPAPKAPTDPTVTTVDEPTASRFKVDGVTYQIDADHLTWGEMADVEDYFGKPMDEINLGSARGMIALVTLAMRREDATVGFADVEGLELGAVEFVEERPTSTPEAAGSPS